MFLSVNLLLEGEPGNCMQLRGSKGSTVAISAISEGIRELDVLQDRTQQ